MINREILEIILSNRCFIYGLGHTVFGGEPNLELLNLIAKEHTSEAFALLSVEDEDILGKMSAFVKTFKEKVKREDFLENVRGEYVKLLIGPGRLTAYPWASVYLSEEKLLFQETTLKVRKAYGECGFSTSSEENVADDHIAIELDFMQSLSKLAFEAFEKDDLDEFKRLVTYQIKFIEEELITWVPSYAEDMVKSKTAYMYPQFAKAIDAFIAIDLELLRDIIK